MVPAIFWQLAGLASLVRKESLVSILKPCLVQHFKAFSEQRLDSENLEPKSSLCYCTDLLARQEEEEEEEEQEDCNNFSISCRYKKRTTHHYAAPARKRPCTEPGGASQGGARGEGY